MRQQTTPCFRSAAEAHEDGRGQQPRVRHIGPVRLLLHFREDSLPGSEAIQERKGIPLEPLGNLAHDLRTPEDRPPQVGGFRTELTKASANGAIVLSVELPLGGKAPPASVLGNKHTEVHCERRIARNLCAKPLVRRHLEVDHLYKAGFEAPVVGATTAR